MRLYFLREFTFFHVALRQDERKCERHDDRDDHADDEEDDFVCEDGEESRESSDTDGDGLHIIQCDEDGCDR